MRPAIGVVSTTCASVVRHTAPNAPEPSAVIRLTDSAGTSDGGIIGAGGGAGACATASNGAINDVATTAAAASVLQGAWCILFLPNFFKSRPSAARFCHTRVCSTNRALTHCDDALVTAAVIGK